MLPIFVLLNTVVFLALAGLHGYWILGGRWGSAASVPTRAGSTAPLFRPGPVATLLVALVLMGGAVLTSSALTGWLPRDWVRYGNGALAAVFLLRAVGEFRYVGFTKRVRHTPFARLDTRYYSPLCLGIALVAFGIFRLVSVA